MQLHLTIDLRAVLIGLVLLLVTAGIATPFAISLADDGDDRRVAQAVSAPVGTAFTYQGQLNDGSGPANGPYDIQARLYEDADAIAIVPGTVPITKEDIQVTNGLFAVALDFGAAAFNGQARYLELRVRPGASTGAFTLLSPLQSLMPTPYALWSVWSATGPFWALAGNAGTTGANYLGTTDNTALELRVNGQRALRIEPGTTPNMIGGYSGNLVASGVDGATIGGGGRADNAWNNRVTDDFGTIGGGNNNQAGDGAGTVDDHALSTVGGGLGNVAAGTVSTVGGGGDNEATSFGATVAGGLHNFSGNQGTTVGGGESNAADGGWATVGGGFKNSAGGQTATVGGGLFNIVSGFGSAVAGGGRNTASGDYSFAAGFRAQATHSGMFVWSDFWDEPFVPADDSVLAGGISNGWVAPQNTFNARSSGGVWFVTGMSEDSGVGSYLAAGSGTWAVSSSRSYKSDFAPVDSGAVLEALSALPLSYWRYEGEDPRARHLGPVAEDFMDAFALGIDDKSITTVDADGVALAAIQGLHAITKEQDARIAGLQAEIDALRGGATSSAPSPSSPAVAPVIQQMGGTSSAALYTVAGAVALFALAVAGHAVMSLWGRPA
jgi:hypothetical protein